MKQMKTDGLETVDINFDDPALPRNVRLLRPLIWHDEQAFCVLLGPDPQEGVFGCGDTVQAALTDWNVHVQERLSSASAADELSGYIRDKLDTASDNIA